MRDRAAFDLPAAFYEDDIFALQELDANERYVPLQRVCARLGLALDDALPTLRGHALLASGLRSLGAEQRATMLEMPQFGVSSSAVHERAAAGRPLRYLVPESVARFIEEKEIYS